MKDRDQLLRVLAVGDLERDRVAFASLERAAGVSVVGVLPDLGEVVSAQAADVVVLGETRERPAASIRRIRSMLPSVRIVVVGDHDDGAIHAAMGAGASGVVPSPSGEDDLVDAVRRAAAGEIVLPAHHVAALVSRVDAGRTRTKQSDALDRLTVREREILRLLAGGSSPAEIGAELGISILTVQTHLKSILAKLGVHSKIEAITIAWRDGLAPVPSSA